MRYDIGSKVPFVAIQYKRAGREYLNGIFGGGSYLPWEDELINIHVEVLTCTEHHKVANEWDTSELPKLDNDGFIFVGGDVSWHNQYPYASYGQLSDTADRIVTRAFPKGTDYKAIPNSTVVQMEAAFHRLSQIQHGIFHIEQDRVESIHNPDKFVKTPEQMAEYILALKDFSTEVQAAIESAAGKKVVIEKLTYGPEKKWLTGHYKARFEDAPSCAHIE